MPHGVEFLGVARLEFGELPLVLEGQFGRGFRAPLRKGFAPLGIDVDLWHGRPLGGSVFGGKVGLEVRKIFWRHPREFDLRRAEILEIAGERRTHRPAPWGHAANTGALRPPGRDCLMVRKSKAADTSVMSPSALAARDSDRTNILDAQRFAKGGPGRDRCNGGQDHFGRQPDEQTA